MAVTMYLTATAHVIDTASTNDFSMLPANTAANRTSVTNTANGPTTIPITQAAANSTKVVFFSRCLRAFTLSGTVTFNIGALESNTSANATIKAKLERCNNVGTVQSTVCDSSFGTELTATAGQKNWTVSPTSTAFAHGDWLKLTLQVTDATSVTLVTGYTVTIRYNNATTYNSYVSLTETPTYFPKKVASKTPNKIKKIAGVVTASCKVVGKV